MHRAATRASDCETLKLLIGANVDVSARDDEGVTALHIAAQWANIKAINLLIAANANVSARTKSGETPLHWAVRKGDDWMPSLFFAMPKGNKAAVKTLMAASVDLKLENEEGESALMLAARDGGNELVRTLITATLKESYQNSVGGTPLHIAVVRGDHMKTGRWVQEEPADIFAQNNDGETALHLIVKKGDLEMAKLLLSGEEIFCVRRLTDLRNAAAQAEPGGDNWSSEFSSPGLDATFDRLDIAGNSSFRFSPTFSSPHSEEAEKSEDRPPITSLQLKEI